MADKAIFISRLKESDLRGWIVTHASYAKGVGMCRLYDSCPLMISMSLTICEKLCSVYVGPQPVPSLQNVPVDGVQVLISLLDKINNFCLCPGIDDIKYEPLIKKHNGKFHDSHGKL